MPEHHASFAVNSRFSLEEGLLLQQLHTPLSFSDWGFPWPSTWSHQQQLLLPSYFQIFPGRGALTLMALYPLLPFKGSLHRIWKGEAWSSLWLLHAGGHVPSGCAPLLNQCLEREEEVPILIWISAWQLLPKSHVRRTLPWFLTILTCESAHRKDFPNPNIWHFSTAGLGKLKASL